MLISNAKRIEKDWSFDLALTNLEVDFLVNHAVASLITKGLILVTEQEDEQEVVLPSLNTTMN